MPFCYTPVRDLKHNDAYIVPCDLKRIPSQFLYICELENLIICSRPFKGYYREELVKMLEKKRKFCLDAVLEEFESLTKDAREVQRETLKKILEENGEAEYLQDLGLGGRTDVESFKSCVPLVTHKDLEPYIQRIVDGDHWPILTAKPITSISLRYDLWVVYVV